LGALETQLAALETEKASLQTQLNVSVEEEHANLLHLSAARSRLLCQVLQTKLPREVRDLIYGYVNAHIRLGYVNIDEPRKSSVHKDGLYIGPSSFDEGTGTLLPYTAARLGHDSLYELTENYYHTCHFRLMDTGMLTGFLYTDRTGTGIVPAKYLSYLAIRLRRKTLYQTVGDKDAKQSFLPDCDLCSRYEPVLASISA
jgi:regulator of replication initiation timing